MQIPDYTKIKFHRTVEMPKGTLEVVVVGSKGLEDTDFLNNTDPYVVLTCRTQEQTSSVASGKGAEPEWNETFLFTISGDVSDLTLKIMDQDAFTNDDFIGEATIPLEPVFMAKSIPTTAYTLVKDHEFCGEIRVALAFTPTPEIEGDEAYGGWEQSSYLE